MAELKLEITRIAHGGEGIGHDETGRVVFVPGAVPGDTVRANPTKVKKRWARAELVRVLEPAGIRVPHACPAAAAGAGCCDYSHIDPAAQPGLKREVLLGQLRHLGGTGDLGDKLETVELEPNLGWRTRVRLGVDAAGRAGVRRGRSSDVVASAHCAQPVAGLLDGLVAAEEGERFTPGAEVVAVMDANGQRHVVETQRVERGRRVEAIDTVREGTGVVTERVHGREFTFPATAFWQAHRAAPEAYAALIADWGAGGYERGDAWDLYGGVGAFVPAIAAATNRARIHTVDSSPAAGATPQPALAEFDVEVVGGKVEASVTTLPAPSLVVLDPPRAGAGAEVVASIAGAGPERVLHVGCDPATLSRDLAAWAANGYRPSRIALLDAFPATHHFETIVQLEK